MSREADIYELRDLIARLRQELIAKETAASDVAPDAEMLAVEISQRRRYLDELMSDLQGLSSAPDAPAPSDDDAPAADAAPQGLAIIIGHSSEGTDKGAIGLSPPFPSTAEQGRAEYFWNEDLAARIEAIANTRQIRVKTFRRRENGGVGIREAYRLAAEWKPQASIELHFNSAGPTARGSETLFGRQGSRPWARALQDRMVALYGRTGSLDRGLKDANVEGRGVLSLTNEVQPSALIEPFFGSNMEDASLGIARKDGLAEAVVNAFATFVGLPVPSADAVTADAPADTGLWDSLRAAYAAMSIEHPHMKAITFAQWALESGHGTSLLAKNHLNFAGMKWRPFMSDVASKVWYNAHDGGEFYCAFASLQNFVAGYWLRLDRHPSYHGWRQHAATPEAFINFIGPIWAPPSANPNYVAKVLDLFDEYRNVFDTMADATYVVAAEPSDEDFWVDRTEDAIALRRNGETADAAARRADHESGVSWASDASSCDYAHLGAGLPVGMQFSFTAADLELLCTLNDFPVQDSGGTPVLFGLRGAGIVQGGSSSDGSWRDEVILKNLRPNHHEIRCVMGAWDRQLGKIAVYPASTVPNAEAVVSWFQTQESGNLLATGFYRYICGEHNGRPGCFLLRKSISEKRIVIVRRSEDDLIYESTDKVHKTAPGDNIHPSFSSETSWFSSFGCQVVVGSATSSGAHSGPWARFRRSAGLTDGDGDPGKPFIYVLLTGQEALQASDARRRNLSLADPEVRAMRRLRFGSTSPRVAALQAQLGQSNDGDLGPATAEALHAKQRSLGNRSDGIYTPALDAQLGWNVYLSADT
ncbi:N-acetylmuramoyl-L-alanine amidase [Bradyrhizobium huanghuaihaiense]|uniref:N-acetylmuramoyl-L-alanine amidase n=1 Tax=Bradyrhizobium huanghuaihaiense TaxID=990078 RepID=A0A562R966_9BRAD|nr:N-acetylmuramoyl-L-alanine amidase [Bradyrhizobium huanghuaihaiense]TWI64970.1 N-acetylmuramoyl-L-alanine amidase [Bradyrhizobium huanghuaihaiense]